MWYPGHIEKAKRKIKEFVKAVDTVLIILDARAPLATTAFEMGIFKNKQLIFVLNKADIANDNYTKIWKKKIAHTNPVVVFHKKMSSKQLKDFVIKNSKSKYGEIRLLVAGVPNVGKSTIINKFSEKKNVKTGAIPGITRGIQWINLGRIKLLDTPGILYSKLFNKDIAAKLLLIGSIPFESVSDYEIVKKAFEIFKVEAKVEETYEEFIEKFGASRGFLGKGGVCDIERSQSTFFKLVSEGKMGKFTYDKEVNLWMQK
ncbi:50S ribosome-binding GTPase [Thermosipho ferrireducens]|uniref:Ribosome biogenesis GTPase A n=1 Tax=Thermosipho ferrireducens TaxID=2571116 RepID=A0ABX7S8N5_9BACT|nr:GTPase [Thermosipho ferrireducens]QTA38258.1 50S ribosome-binding GTPase [Thermosipho ferrireducens]